MGLSVIPMIFAATAAVGVIVTVARSAFTVYRDPCVPSRLSVVMSWCMLVAVIVGRASVIAGVLS